MRSIVITERETTTSGTIDDGALAVSIYNEGPGYAFLSSAAGVGRVPPNSSKNLESLSGTLPELFYDGNGNQVFITILRR